MRLQRLNMSNVFMEVLRCACHPADTHGRIEGRNSEVIQPGPPDFPVKGPKYPEAGHKFLGSVRGSEA